jgi:hypothetical protein
MSKREALSLIAGIVAAVYDGRFWLSLLELTKCQQLMPELSDFLTTL